MKNYESYPGKPLEFLKNFSDEEWQQAKNNLFNLNGKLAESDMNRDANDDEGFFDLLQRKTGKSREELIQIMMKGQREVSQEKS